MFLTASSEVIAEDFEAKNGSGNFSVMVRTWLSSQDGSFTARVTKELMPPCISTGRRYVPAAPLAENQCAAWTSGSSETRG